MKRYEPGIVTDEYDMVEDELGDYVLYSDVLREMIPRPDADEARKAVGAFLIAYKVYGQYSAKFEEAKAALLRLMGVES